VAEDVVQVAGELVALVGEGQPGDLVPGLGQLRVALDHLAHTPGGQGGNEDLEGHGPVDRPAVYLPGDDERGRDAGRDHGPGHPGGQQEHGHHGQVDQQDAGERPKAQVAEGHQRGLSNHDGHADPAGHLAVPPVPQIAGGSKRGHEHQRENDQVGQPEVAAHRIRA
jgi:hypothetical protein